MPKYYCDYCDTYLTHDSPSVRKTHCTGRKHKENVRDYYQKWMEEKAQRLIDQTTAAFKSGKIQPGMYPPIRPGFQIPPGFPIPQGIPILPPVLPPGIAPPISMIPGIPPPPRMIIPPPLVSSSQSTNLPSNSNVNSGILPGNPLLNSFMNPFIRPPSGLPPLISPAQNLPGVNSTTVQTTNTTSGSNSSNTTIQSLMSISDSNPI